VGETTAPGQGARHVTPTLWTYLGEPVVAVRADAVVGVVLREHREHEPVVLFVQLGADVGLQLVVGDLRFAPDSGADEVRVGNLSAGWVETEGGEGGRCV